MLNGFYYLFSELLLKDSNSESKQIQKHVFISREKWKHPLLAANNRIDIVKQLNGAILIIGASCMLNKTPLSALFYCLTVCMSHKESVNVQDGI